MKFEEIKCVLSIEERLKLVESVKEIVGGPTPFICRSIKYYLYNNGIPYQLEVGRCIEKLDEQFCTLETSLYGDTPTIEPVLDTDTEVLLRLYLPELLTYRPKVLAKGGGFWNKGDMSSRMSALNWISENLKEQLLNKENHD